jgi:IstB-like ATP binding protein
LPIAGVAGSSGKEGWPAARFLAARRSMSITANQPFGEWGKVFPDQAMTLAAIDRLVHHATILEMNVESYPSPCCTRSQARSRSAANPRDNEGQKLIDAPRQSKPEPTKKLLPTA